MPRIADREIHLGTAAERDRSLALERRGCVAHEVQECLHDLVPIEVDQRQARIVVASYRRRIAVLGLDNRHDVFEQLVDVDRPFLRRAARPEQGVDERCETVRLADDDACVLAQFLVFELSLEQLCSPANTAERVLDLVGKLPNHLPAGAMLDQERILAGDPRAARDVGQLDEQRCLAAANR